MLTFIFRERLEDKRIYKFLVLLKRDELRCNVPYQQVVGYFLVNAEHEKYDLPENIKTLIAYDLLESVEDAHKQELIEKGSYTDEYFYSDEAAKIRRERSQKMAIQRILEEAKRVDKFFFE